VGERDVLVTGQGRQAGALYDDEARCPGLALDRLAVMRARGIPGNELPRLYERRSGPRRERIGSPATIPKTYSPRGSMA
jgi:hypothetical protein